MHTLAVPLQGRLHGSAVPLVATSKIRSGSGVVAWRGPELSVGTDTIALDASGTLPPAHVTQRWCLAGEVLLCLLSALHAVQQLSKVLATLSARHIRMGPWRYQGEGPGAGGCNGGLVVAPGGASGCLGLGVRYRGVGGTHGVGREGDLSRTLWWDAGRGSGCWGGGVVRKGGLCEGVEPGEELASGRRGKE